MTYAMLQRSILAIWVVALLYGTMTLVMHVIRNEHDSIEFKIVIIKNEVGMSS